MKRVKGIVLLVEDEVKLIDLFARVLEPEGITLHGVTTVADGLAKLNERVYEVILLDLNLPDANGLELLRFVRSRSFESEVIILSAETSFKKAIEALKLGANDFISKPIPNVNIFLKRVQKSIENVHLKRERTALVEHLHRLNEKLEDMVEARTEELVTANEELRKAEQTRSQFLATISHELKTPIATIQSFSEILTECPPESQSKRDEFIRIIYGESHRLGTMISDLLDQAKMEVGKMDYVFGPHLPQDLFEDAINPMVALLVRAKISFTVVSPKNLPPVLADRDRIKQVFTNLIHNSLKNTQPGDRISLTAAIDDQVREGAFRQYILFTVSDTGRGIPKSQLRNIFKQFYQVARQGTKPRGVGLGLAITHEIIRSHQGDIWVQSQSGQGTEFSFILPVAKPPY